MKKQYLVFIVTLLVCKITLAQNDVDTVKSWNFKSLSQVSISNLEADKTSWEWNTKGRYVNKFTTDGTPLKANGCIISEYEGLLVGKGIEAGSLLLWKSESTNNGLQMQRSAEVSFDGVKTTSCSLKSSPLQKTQQVSIQSEI